MRSLRTTLLLTLLSAMALALLGCAWATYRMEFQQADALLDHHLRQVALALRDRGFPNSSAPQVESPGQDFDYSIQVWNEQGTTIYYSYPPHVFPNRAQLGFATVQTEDGPWRMYALQGRGSIIQVAQPMSRRDALAAAAAWRSLRPILLLFPAMGMLIWLIVGRGLAPMARLARAVTLRRPDALTPVTEPVPREAEPLVTALNDLLARLHRALELQRQFVADAAHELRTPITALQLQMQLVERTKSEEERAAAIEELKLGLQRTARVVQQLLTLAREEPGTSHPPATAVDLAALIADVVDTCRPLAHAKNIRLALSTEPALNVTADATALRTLFANVLDNALQYTPADGEVTVSATAHTQRAIVTVEDSGPGIPAAERERVFDRFYCCPASSQPGTGLGLAIVKAIATRHGLDVSLSTSAAGGLCVRIEFPEITPEASLAP